MQIKLMRGKKITTEERRQLKDADARGSSAVTGTLFRYSELLISIDVPAFCRETYVPASCS
jgi:hypothetical protein